VNIEWKQEEYWGTPSELVKYFNLDNFCKGWIDENSIISYNNLFCSINNQKTTSKEEVRSELINPKFLNIFPFDWYAQIDKENENRSNNNWLTFNMNMLGSDTLKKQLGAFFTPDKYIKISTKYLRNAIKNVPK
jgi:glycosylphosphatidylinositol transamidase (GPIT) subunit GPI8